ncbi:hypothetical protein DFH06DRAFT_243379 [Mycena polygramma]|nr:hypothetical protein DFH06DRAFT_243379 [Mycena polygramma]
MYFITATILVSFAFTGYQHLSISLTQSPGCILYFSRPHGAWRASAPRYISLSSPSVDIPFDSGWGSSEFVRTSFFAIRLAMGNIRCSGDIDIIPRGVLRGTSSLVSAAPPQCTNLKLLVPDPTAHGAHLPSVKSTPLLSRHPVRLGVESRSGKSLLFSRCKTRVESF